jgi:hypothetical protein
VVIDFQTEKAISSKVEFVDANCPAEKWPKPRVQSFFSCSHGSDPFFIPSYVNTLLRKRAIWLSCSVARLSGGRVSSSAYGTIDSKDNPLQKYCMTCQTHLLANYSTW